MSLEMKIVDLGQQTYATAWVKQQEMLQKRVAGEIDDSLMLVEHPPTITLGIDPKWNKLKVPEATLQERGVAFHSKTSRGGGSAYLGPGQLVGYVHAEIAQYGGILRFMKMLEEVMIRTAADFNIPVQRHDTMNPTTDKPYRATWYVADGKNYVLCTKGIGVQSTTKGGKYTHHGFCLNVSPNTTYFDLIDPCGFPISEVQPISMEEILGSKVPMAEVKESVARNFKNVLMEARQQYVPA